MPERSDEFFVGYAPAMPAGVKSLARRAAVALVVVAIVVPVVLVLAQTRLAPASFEFGVTRSFRGTIHSTPFATLVVARPNARDAADGASSFLLVAPGKHGAEDLVRGRDGATVELRGTLIYRAGQVMIEVEPDSLVDVPASASAGAAAPVTDLGQVRLAGEIIDTKCHLGVMNPGDGKTHRDCAVRCISGGIPPALHVRDASGEERLFLLVGKNGEQIGSELLPFVAEPVEVTGRAERRGDLLVLYADPAVVRRLGEKG